MSRLHRPSPFGLSSSNWPWFVLIAAGVLRLASRADASLSPALVAWPEPIKWVFERITDLGEAGWILIPALVLFVISLALVRLGRQRAPRLALLEMAQLYGFILAAVGGASLAANLLKRIIGRGRPVVLHDAGAFDFRHWALDWRYEGFPSGHATTIFAAAVVVGFLSPRWFPLMVGIAVLVGISRVVVGMHYPTDVVGGALLGTLVAYAVRGWFVSRGWLFHRLNDGRVVARPFAATRRLARPRRRAQEASL